MTNEKQQAGQSLNAPIPAQGITVEIPYATVPAFQQAVEVARQHPTFQEFGEGKGSKIRATYQLNELEALQQLKDAVWELRHKRAWLHGEEIEWHRMAQMTHCFQEYLHRPRSDHCFFDGNFWSGFGCRYAIANLADRINNEWLSFGHLDSGGVWVFDKPRIAEHVKRNLYTGFQNCPAFDAEYLEHFLEVFPERIDAIEDDRWQHLKNRQGQIIGVGPKGLDAAKKIISELQDKICERRGRDRVQANGKRKLPAKVFAPYQKPRKRKKGLLARLIG